MRPSENRWIAYPCVFSQPGYGQKQPDPCPRQHSVACVHRRACPVDGVRAPISPDGGHPARCALGSSGVLVDRRRQLALANQHIAPALQRRRTCMPKVCQPRPWQPQFRRQGPLWQVAHSSWRPIGDGIRGRDRSPWNHFEQPKRPRKFFSEVGRLIHPFHHQICGLETRS